MGSLGPRCTLPFRARRPERSVLWCAYGPGQDLTRLVRVRYTLSIHTPFSYTCCRESFPTTHGDELIQFLLNITGRSISLSLGKVILRKLFVAVCRLSSSSLSSFLYPHVIHYSSPVIRACSEACAPRPFPLAKLDCCDLYGALYRRGNY